MKLYIASLATIENETDFKKIQKFINFYGEYFYYDIIVTAYFFVWLDFTTIQY